MAQRIGGATRTFVRQLTLDPSSVSANSVSQETFAVTGVRVEHQYIADAPSLESGLFLLGAIATAKDVLQLTIWNPTGGAINPASQTFRVVGI